MHRLEHDMPVAGTGRMVPPLDRHRHDGSRPGRLLDAALAAVPDAALAVRYATDIQRLHCMLHDAHGTQIEAALDIGTASAGRLSAPIVELELEHKGGPVQGLFDLAMAWQSRGSLWLCSITKAQRGERLLLRDAEPVALKARSVRLDRAADGAALLRVLWRKRCSGGTTTLLSQPRHFAPPPRPIPTLGLPPATCRRIW